MKQLPLLAALVVASCAATTSPARDADHRWCEIATQDYPRIAEVVYPYNPTARAAFVQQKFDWCMTRRQASRRPD